VERLIGSIRRECFDHVVVISERHLRHLLLSYMNYYNEARTPAIEQGCVNLTCRRHHRTYYQAARPRRVASPICSDLIFGKHKDQGRVSKEAAGRGHHWAQT
jgi:hypothetical protein